jgi:hypothetical protein
MILATAASAMMLAWERPKEEQAREEEDREKENKQKNPMN